MFLQRRMKMYGDVDVQFLTDEYDTVLAYENKGKVDQAADKANPLMVPLTALTEFNKWNLFVNIMI